jgi:hypothetical protein
MSGMNLSVDEKLITPVIEAEIKAAILKHLGSDVDKIIQGLVHRALATKVDDNGRINRDSYYNKTGILDYLFREGIHKAAAEAVQKLLEEENGKIVASVEKEIMNSKNDIASNLVRSVVDAASSQYRFKVVIENNDNEED